MPITPTLAFQAASNQAAAATTSVPPYVRYHVRTHIVIPRVHRQRDYDDLIETRMSDDRSVVTDMDKHRTTVQPHAFPVAPSFDALSDFSYQYGMNFHKIWFEVTSARKRRYAEQIKSDADVTARSLSDYNVKFAPDSSTDPHGIMHLVLTPYPATRARQNYYFHEVWIDNSTGMPTRVAFDGAHNLNMYFDYTVTGGRWIVSHAHLEQDMPAPFHIGKVHFLADSYFSDVTFSETADAAELK